MDLRPGYPDIVDEITVRLVAVVVLAVGVAALVSGAWWLYAALAVDFILRAVWGPRVSPIAQGILRWVRPLVPAAPRPTAGPPKRFAASIGAVATVVAATAGAIAAAGGPAAASTIACPRSTSGSRPSSPTSSRAPTPSRGCRGAP